MKNEDLKRFYETCHIPEENKDFVRYGSDGSIKSKYNATKNDEVNSLNFTQEQRELLECFEEYDKQVMQYQRCQRLGVEFDRDIEELDNQATEKQLRFREIKKELGE